MLQIVVNYHKVCPSHLWVLPHERADCLPRKVHVRFSEADDNLRVAFESVAIVVLLFFYFKGISFNEVLSDEESADVMSRPHELSRGGVGEGKEDLHYTSIRTIFILGLS